jgi:uncharacterized membrane-anchored protein
MHNETSDNGLSKVPEVTFIFWVIKVAATTLGETGGDSVTMTLNLGYLAGTLLFLGVLIALIIAQIVARRFYPSLYWATIVASTTFGTTMADFADRSLGIGYTGGSTLLLFWAAFILTRPLGATAGDFLDKPVTQGGLALSRPLASVMIAGFIVLCIVILPQRAGRVPA